VNNLTDSTPSDHGTTEIAPAKRLLIAASGTGGHVFPAIAVAEQLPDYQIEWLGVPDRLETQLVPSRYPLHTVTVGGFQKKGLAMLKVLVKLLVSVGQVRRLLKQGKFEGIFTTGGYIAAPAVLAARSLGLPVLLHESNALPGKVTRFLGPLCSSVALGFAAAAQYLPHSQTVWVGTPVREQFLQDSSTFLPDLDIPVDVSLVAVVGGSQGAVAVNRLVRQCAPVWLEAGIWVVHQTGDNDPEAGSFHHPHYLPIPFYPHMAALFRRADLVISRAGAGTLTELAIAHTPSILIPYPYAAEDHQTYNAKVFAEAGAAVLFQQSELSPEILQEQVLALIENGANQPGKSALKEMAEKAGSLAVPDSAKRLAEKIRQLLAD
jgi:UDP-N-acetylglucosamine--N-acetylmuramyl-(pentapeptide) pyrophosphoryl-undecaprenol N-acetylglucosamine transferase